MPPSCPGGTTELGQPEVGEVEARRDHAADEYRRRATRYRRLPHPAPYPHLRAVTGGEVAAEQYHLAGCRLGAGATQAQLQRPAAVPEPELVRAHHVPSRPLPRLEQEVDGG